jgi:hypothetical protein
VNYYYLLKVDKNKIIYKNNMINLIIITIIFLIIIIIISLLIFLNKIEKFEIDINNPISISGTGTYLLTNVNNNETDSYYKFTKGSCLFDLRQDLTCSVLVVGGGGSGGSQGKNGNGGGILLFNDITLKSGEYLITIGEGGEKVLLNNHNQINGNNGSNTIITSKSEIIYKAGGGNGGGVVIETFISESRTHNVWQNSYSYLFEPNINIMGDPTNKIIYPSTLINITGEDIYYGGTYNSLNEIEKDALDNTGSGGKGIIYNQMYPNNSTGKGGSGIVIIRFNRILNKLEYDETKSSFIRAKEKSNEVIIDLTDLNEYDVDLKIKINRKICNDNLGYIINKLDLIHPKISDTISSNSIDILNDLYKDVKDTKKDILGFSDIIYEKTTQSKIIAENISDESIIKSNMISITNDIIDVNNDSIYYYSLISILTVDVSSIIDIRTSIININNYDSNVDNITNELLPLKDLVVILLKVSDATRIGDLAIIENNKAISAFNSISSENIETSKITPDYNNLIIKGNNVKKKASDLFDYYGSVEYSYYNKIVLGNDSIYDYFLKSDENKLIVINTINNNFNENTLFISVVNINYAIDKTNYVIELASYADAIYSNILEFIRNISETSIHINNAINIRDIANNTKDNTINNSIICNNAIKEVEKSIEIKKLFDKYNLFIDNINSNIKNAEETNNITIIYDNISNAINNYNNSLIKVEEITTEVELITEITVIKEKINNLILILNADLINIHSTIIDKKSSLETGVLTQITDIYLNIINVKLIDADTNNRYVLEELTKIITAEYLENANENLSNLKSYVTEINSINTNVNTQKTTAENKNNNIPENASIKIRANSLISTINQSKITINNINEFVNQIQLDCDKIILILINIININKYYLQANSKKSEYIKTKNITEKSKLQTECFENIENGKNEYKIAKDTISNILIDTSLSDDKTKLNNRIENIYKLITNIDSDFNLDIIKIIEDIRIDILNVKKLNANSNKSTIDSEILNLINANSLDIATSIISNIKTNVSNIRTIKTDADNQKEFANNLNSSIPTSASIKSDITIKINNIDENVSNINIINNYTNQLSLDADNIKLILTNIRNITTYNLNASKNISDLIKTDNISAKSSLFNNYYSNISNAKQEYNDAKTTLDNVLNDISQTSNKTILSNKIETANSSITTLNDKSESTILSQINNINISIKDVQLENTSNNQITILNEIINLIDSSTEAIANEKLRLITSNNQAIIDIFNNVSSLIISANNLNDSIPNESSIKTMANSYIAEIRTNNLSIQSIKTFVETLKLNSDVIVLILTNIRVMYSNITNANNKITEFNRSTNTNTKASLLAECYTFLSNASTEYTTATNRIRNILNHETQRDNKTKLQSKIDSANRAYQTANDNYTTRLSNFNSDQASLLTQLELIKNNSINYLTYSRSSNSDILVELNNIIDTNSSSLATTYYSTITSKITVIDRYLTLVTTDKTNAISYNNNILSSSSIKTTADQHKDNTISNSNNIYLEVVKSYKIRSDGLNIKDCKSYIETINTNITNINSVNSSVDILIGQIETNITTYNSSKTITNYNNIFDKQNEFKNYNRTNYTNNRTNIINAITPVRRYLNNIPSFTENQKTIAFKTTTSTFLTNKETEANNIFTDITNKLNNSTNLTLINSVNTNIDTEFESAFGAFNRKVKEIADLEREKSAINKDNLNRILGEKNTNLSNIRTSIQNTRNAIATKNELVTKYYSLKGKGDRLLGIINTYKEYENYWYNNNQTLLKNLHYWEDVYYNHRDTRQEVYNQMMKDRNSYLDAFTNFKLAEANLNNVINEFNPLVEPINNLYWSIDWSDLDGRLNGELNTERNAIAEQSTAQTNYNNALNRYNELERLIPIKNSEKLPLETIYINKKDLLYNKIFKETNRDKAYIDSEIAKKETELKILNCNDEYTIGKMKNYYNQAWGGKHSISTIVKTNKVNNNICDVRYNFTGGYNGQDRRRFYFDDNENCNGMDESANI